MCSLVDPEYKSEHSSGDLAVSGLLVEDLQALPVLCTPPIFEEIEDSLILLFRS